MKLPDHVKHLLENRGTKDHARAAETLLAVLHDATQKLEVELAPFMELGEIKRLVRAAIDGAVAPAETGLTRAWWEDHIKERGGEEYESDYSQALEDVRCLEFLNPAARRASEKEPEARRRWGRPNPLEHAARVGEAMGETISLMARDEEDLRLLVLPERGGHED